MNSYLIINADDYGMSFSTNQAVEHLFGEGAITSTTLMTPCPWAEDGIQRAKRNPKMRVGLHLTLTAEWETYRWGPVSREGVSSLLDDGGYFPRGCGELLLKARREDIVREMNAQLKHMELRGLSPTHVDNHMGSLYGLEGPGYVDAVFELCAPRKWGFRIPRTAAGFGALSPEMERMLEQAGVQADKLGIRILDALLSFPRALRPDDTYETIKAEYIGVIRGLKPGLNELFMHPAADCEELRAICPAWQMRVWEYRVLLDEDFRKAIVDSGMELVGWR